MKDLVDLWVAENTKLIKASLEKARQDAIKHHQKTPGWADLLPYIDLAFYDYCEMELCYACEDIPPPLSYQFERGRVDTPGMMVDHKYYRNNTNIVCLTPGQFWFFPDHKFNGDTVRSMMKIAPNLVRHVRGIFFLSGDENEIYEKLNIQYK